nr:PREDICTED: LOW QUALITY PROTEIN: uncharacterized protein LOC662495 [Tribolium castaneum]|eukprot:XP_973680.3 PREDICTED: LOW QUALITY PROTEIN: uncharacterized protein LOC662495 [Tribolium castaneum]
MTSAVPAILKYLSDSSNYNIDQNMEAPVRAKKRRLDHLTWEEKLQRKKLKNRVAAQTSRDRKKAKMDQMEKALQELFSKNEVLVQECERLKGLNERLSAENASLRSRFSTCSCPQSRSVECESASGPAVSLLRPQGALTHSAAALSQQTALLKIVLACSLPDLLDELNSDVDISSLEQLTQSLLQDIARDLEAAAEKADIQEQVACQEDSAGQVVGPAPEQLEPDGSEVLSEKQDPLIKDISQYLLLHHNYSARPPPEDEVKARRTSTTRAQQRNKLASDYVLGTYDESTNCITIIVDEDMETSTIEEGVSPGDDESLLRVETSLECTSPRSSSSSDCGYESLGSPESQNEDLWDDSVSELFPSLL